jgi:hypothetical protein
LFGLWYADAPHLACSTRSRPIPRLTHTVTHASGGFSSGWLLMAMVRAGCMAFVVWGAPGLASVRLRSAFTGSPMFTSQTSGAWSAAAPMCGRRSGNSAVLLRNGEVFVAGLSFDTDSGHCGAAELYEPRTDRWRAAASPPTGFSPGDTATRLRNGQVLVTGLQGLAQQPASELYNPNNDTWHEARNFAGPRRFQTATLLGNGDVLLVGGDGCALCKRMPSEIYRTPEGRWGTTGRLRHGRFFHTAALLPDGRVLVAGGEGCGRGDRPGICRSAELYNPATGRWQLTGSMHVPREEHTATLLRSGLVLVAGGYGCEPYEVCRSAELYDPRTGRWKYTGTMQSARAGQSATLLKNGQVLVTGGYTCTAGACSHLASAELYDSGSGSWRTAGNMAAGREYQAATRLRNGSVLVAGGTTVCPAAHGCTAIASTEIYTPGRSDPPATSRIDGRARVGSPATAGRQHPVATHGKAAACSSPVFHSSGLPNRPATPLVQVGPNGSAFTGDFFFGSRLYHANGDIRDDIITKVLWTGPNGYSPSSITGYDMSSGPNPPPTKLNDGAQVFPRPGCWRVEFRQDSPNIVRSTTFQVLGD